MQQPIEYRSIYSLFKQQLHSAANRAALLWEDERITYSQLDSLAEKVAKELKSFGITPNSVVGLEMDRCRELIPCLLAIFKMDCAYVPLLPSLPKERRDFILKDSGAICKIRIERGEIKLEATGLSAPPHSDSLLAYILYTSGSTGRPKGVKITQDALSNRLLWQQSHFELNETDVLLQKTSLGFDVSLWELFWAFTVGAALRVPEPGAEKEPRRLFELIAQDGIGIIHFVPSMLTEFLEAYAAAGKPPLPLRKVIVSGEALTPALNRRFYELMGSFATLHNLYGPTECTVDVLYYDCKPEDTEIPIGKTVWNTGAHILGSDGNELPQAEQGELCITGIQLAQGYADSSLDAGRFEIHPRLGRIYRTGDIASLRTDGEILYHGRGDSQVKIRGQRVELGEIEAALCEISELRQAAVLWDGSRLNAFYLSALPLRDKYLRGLLSKTLPDYMLPDSFLRLEEFPLNASGKLDRKALAAIKIKDSASGADSQQQSKKAIEHPRSPAEHSLISILSKHFGIDGVSMTTQPLSLGLDSLELVRLTTLLGEHGIMVAVNDFFTAQSLRELVNAAKSCDVPVLLKIAECGDIEEAESSITYIGIPYGGGGFGVYSDLARELCNVSRETFSFYAAGNASVDIDELLAKMENLPKKRVVIISTCVGSASALSLAYELEKKGITAEGVFLLSIAPALKYKKSPWRFWSNRSINFFLGYIHGQKFRLSKHEMKNFRRDTDHFFSWQHNPCIPQKTPVCLIVGEMDPMLRKLDPGLEWQKLLGRNITVKKIPDGMHYLPHTHSKHLADLILNL